MASELSELRAELWRTRDNLERIKSRTPPSTGQSSRRLFDRRHHAGHKNADIENSGPPRSDERDGIKTLKFEQSGCGKRSGPTSPPTSAGSSGSNPNNGRSTSGGGGRGFSDEVAAEETLSNLELEGAAFKNWTEEASTIAVRLIEEVKTLRWERTTWAEREVASERAAAELRERTEALERRLLATETDASRTQDALLKAQHAERQQAMAAERAKADLRAAQERPGELRARVDALRGGDREVGVERLRDELRREKEGADALQRRLNDARAASARHEAERKEWHTSRARLEELRRLWGKQLKKVEKKVRTMAKENEALQGRVAEADRAKERAEIEARRNSDELRRLTEQRDNLLLGATRTGHLSASSPADALAELLAAAAASVVAGAGDGDHAMACRSARARGLEQKGVRGWDNKLSDCAGSHGRTDDLEAELERARAEAKLARVAVKQERLRREEVASEKEEAVRQLRRLMGAAKRAVSKKDARLRSSRMETEVVWNALTEAVR